MAEPPKREGWVHLGDGKQNTFQDFNIEGPFGDRPALTVGNQEGSVFQRFNIGSKASFLGALSQMHPDMKREQLDDVVEILKKYHDQPEKRTGFLATIGVLLVNGASFVTDVIQLAKDTGFISQ